MRLRPLTEAECYARCYGGARTEQVSVLRSEPARTERKRPVAVRVREVKSRERRPETA